MEMRIVCFGDSLTEGYQSACVGPGLGVTPYGGFLQERLGECGRVLVRGVCGETTQDMRQRYAVDVLALSPHYVVILGGTNDLGWGLSPQSVFDNLVWMYAEAQSNGILPVGVTIPSLGGLAQGDYGDSPYLQAIRARKAVNQSLTEYCESKQIALVDLFTATCDAQYQELAPQFSEDGLHLTTLGYRTLADLLWFQVFEPLLEVPRREGRNL